MANKKLKVIILKQILSILGIMAILPAINGYWGIVTGDAEFMFMGTAITLSLYLIYGNQLLPAIAIYVGVSSVLSITFVQVELAPAWEGKPPEVWEMILTCILVTSGELGQLYITRRIIMRYKDPRRLFEETSDVFLFLGVTSVVYLACSCVISLGWVFAHYGQWDRYLWGIFAWFREEIVGIFFITPIILSWLVESSRSEKMTKRQMYQFIALTAFIFALALYCYSGWFGVPLLAEYPVFWIIITVWIAYYFKPSLALSVVGIISFSILYGIILEGHVKDFSAVAYISGEERASRTLYTQILVLTLIISTLLISVSRAENARIRSDLQRLNRKLEQRVKERNHELNHQLRTQSLINHVASAANATQNPDEALAVALKAICEFSHCHLGRAFLINKDNNGIHFVSTDIRFGEGHAELDNLESLTDTFTVHPNATLPAQVYQHRKPVLLQAGTSPEAEPAALDDSIDIGDSLYDKLSIRAAFGCPVLVGDEVCAVLEGYSRHDQLPSDLKVVLRQVGVVLGRVFERQAAVIEKQRLNQQLVQASRQAGMSEVASGVLHNVGNVLNSVNVANQTARDLITRSSLPGLEKTLSLIEQQTDLKAFLSQPIAANDEGGNTKAHSLLAYLDKLHDKLSHEHQLALHELDQLHTNIEHIKNIISRQQQYARPTQALEPVLVEQLVNDALLIHAQSFSRQDIEVIRQVDRLGECYLDRHQVLQIVGNLISNAGQAVAANTGSKQITLSVRSSAGFLYLSVEDNGCGIAPEHQAKIFRHGFTTKREGHGFGLHASANTAQEMGGSLSFSSAGKGQGTCFMLKLPYKPLRVTA